MKKIIFLLLTFIMCISLCACVGKKSPEEILEQSQELNWETIEKSISDNKAKAIEDYENKLFNYTASVMNVEEKYCIVSELKSSTSPLVKVYMDNESLCEIHKGDLITIIGSLKNIDTKEIKDAVIIKIVAAENNIVYLKETFIDDFESAKILLNSKDKFSKLTGEELKQTIPSGWIEQKWYFKTSSNEYEKFAQYTGIIKIEANGTGYVQTPGNETIDWFIDENNLYIKTNTNSEKISKDDKYKYDVCRLDDETLICFGQNDVFLLISNMLLK